MESLATLIFVALFAIVFSATSEHPRGCIYIHGRCHRECEEGTRSYNTGCGYRTPEATCDEPNPKEDTSAYICDYSACYCEPPTVRDTKTNKCIPIEECSKNNNMGPNVPVLVAK